MSYAAKQFKSGSQQPKHALALFRELRPRLPDLGEAHRLASRWFFLRGGVPIAPSGRVFTFELAPGTPRLEADTLASLLNRRITHLVETQTDPEIASQDNPEPDGAPEAPKPDDPEAADGPTYTPV